MQKPHLVRWKTICLEKRKGGLGSEVPYYDGQGFTLQGELVFHNDEESLWKQVIS